jgi:membrane-associated phospholipid phosphatase
MATPPDRTRRLDREAFALTVGVLLPLLLLLPLRTIRGSWPLDELIPDPALDRGLGLMGRAIAGFSALGGPEMVALLIAGIVGWLVFAGRRGDAVFVPVAFLLAHLAGRLVKAWAAAPRPAVGGEELYGVHGLPSVTPLVVCLGLLVLALRPAWRSWALAGAMAIAGLGVADQAAGVLLPAEPLMDAFPSGHAVASMAVVICALAVAPSRWRPVLAVVGLVFAVGVGVSRVYLDAHLPADVVAGWCVAIAAASAVLLVRRVAGVPTPGSRVGDDAVSGAVAPGVEPAGVQVPDRR